MEGKGIFKERWNRSMRKPERVSQGSSRRKEFEEKV